MKMRKIILLVFGFLVLSQMINATSSLLPSDELSDDFMVFQGMKKVNSVGKKLSYAFAKGDQVTIKFSTRKDKNLKHVKMADLKGTKVLWSINNVASGSYDVKISEEGVYTIEFLAKGMGSRDVTIDIVRKAGAKKVFNTAWMKYNSFTPREVTYSVDSMIGYKEPVKTQQEIKIFNKYYYQNVQLYKHSKQLLGQAGVHNSQAVSYPMAITKDKIPAGAKFKCYTYSLSSVLGGAKHWAIAEIAVSAGALFLSPVGAFAAHGAMGLIGPEPGNEPVQYFMSNSQRDLGIVKQIYSPSNEAKKGTNWVAGKVGLDKKKVWSERDLSFNQKGKVTNLFVSSAHPPKASFFIMANPEYTQAKNTKMSGSAIFYAPTYRPVIANEFYYELQTVPVEKKALDYSKKEVYGTIAK